MARTKERADMKGETQAKQEGKCRSCPLGLWPGAVTALREEVLSTAIRTALDTLRGCHLHVSTWRIERHHYSA